MANRLSILGGKVQLFKRANSPYWQSTASVGGRQFQASTKEDSLAHAKTAAEDWYLNLKGVHRWGGGVSRGKTFRQAAETFLSEYEVLTGGERSPAYVKTMRIRIDVHLNPFFGDKVVSDINESLVMDYRVARAMTKDKNGLPRAPARTTLHHEIQALRHILKTAKRHGWLTALPDLSAPYKTSGKISHRAWFSPEEYRALYKASGQRARKPANPKWTWECEQFHDYVLFMANTGLRPDEAARLEFRDVVIVDDDATGERILEIEVRGKRGVGVGKSMPGAVRPFERLRERSRVVIQQTADTPSPKGHSRGGGEPDGLAKPGPKDRIFGSVQRELMNTVLDELGLKVDRDGQRRTAYSLRHTYICFRLMEGADIYQVAKNCRTSVEMIEKYYASHIKNRLDAAAINVRRPKRATPSKARPLTPQEV
jgi:integrase